MQNFGIPDRSQAKSQRFVHVEGSRVCARAKSQLHSGLEVGLGRRVCSPFTSLSGSLRAKSVWPSGAFKNEWSHGVLGGCSCLSVWLLIWDLVVASRFPWWDQAHVRLCSGGVEPDSLSPSLCSSSCSRALSLSLSLSLINIKKKKWMVSQCQKRDCWEQPLDSGCVQFSIFPRNWRAQILTL